MGENKSLSRSGSAAAPVCTSCCFPTWGGGGSPVLRAVRRGCHESTAKHGLLVRLLTLERNDGGAEGSRSS